MSAKPLSSFSFEPYELYVGDPAVQDLLHPSVRMTGILMGVKGDDNKGLRLIDMPPEKTFYSMSVLNKVEANVTLIQTPVLLAVRRRDGALDNDMPCALIGMAVQRGLLNRKHKSYQPRLEALFEMLWPRSLEQLGRDTANLEQDQRFALIHNQKVQRNAFEGELWHCQLMRFGNMINHSCAPNSCAVPDETMMEMRIVSVRPLMDKEEITIGYTHWPIDNPEARAQLLKHQGFKCMCPCCNHDIAPSLLLASFGVPLRNKPHCWWCGALQGARPCTRCRVAHYCNAACQRANWPTHKLICKEL
jgi:hypothetical protein